MEIELCNTKNNEPISDFEKDLTNVLEKQMTERQVNIKVIEKLTGPYSVHKY